MDPVPSIRTTSCPLDCPDTCTLAVTVETGRLVAVGAAPGNPLTHGFICQKVSRHAQRVYAPERVLTPLVRTGPKGSGEFRSATVGRRARPRRGPDPRRHRGRRARVGRAVDLQLVGAGAADRAADAAVPACSAHRGRRHDLRGDPGQGVGRDVRRDALGRSARCRARAARRRVGREPGGEQHALPAARDEAPSETVRSSSSSTRGARAWPSAPTCTWRRGPVPTWSLALADRARARAHRPRSIARSSPRTPRASTSSSPRPTSGRSRAPSEITGVDARGIGALAGLLADVRPAFFRVGLGARADAQRWVRVRRRVRAAGAHGSVRAYWEAASYASTADGSPLGAAPRRHARSAAGAEHEPPRPLPHDRAAGSAGARAVRHRREPGGERARSSSSCSTGWRATTSSRSCTTRC